MSIGWVDAGRASRQDTDEASPASYEVMSARPANGAPEAGRSNRWPGQQADSQWLSHDPEGYKHHQCQWSGLALGTIGSRTTQGESMTTLDDRPQTALLIIDVQTGVVQDGYRRAEVLANIGTLVDQARREQVPVVWVQHFSEQLVKGSEAWQLAPELERDQAEPLVEKTYGDAFEATDLEQVLSGLRVGRLVVTGAQTDACVRSTLHGAKVRGYDTTLVSDAHLAGDLTSYGAPPPEQVVAHTNLYWSYESAPGRTAGIAETAKIDFGPAA